MEEQRATLNRVWVAKMTIGIIALAGLGLWGLWDATVRFPNRGARAAEWAELDYLNAANEAGRISLASEEHPKRVFRDLRGRHRDLERTIQDARQANNTRSVREVDMELQKLRWLTALSRVGKLDTEHTVIDIPRQRRDELSEKLESLDPPKPLAAYDLPLQWLFVVVGLGGAAYLSLLFVRVSRSAAGYRYDPEERRLTLPDGTQLTPDDIEEVDKRKWDKFFVFLHIKDRSEEIKLDLYRYKEIEEWILEIEKHTEGYVPPEPEEEIDTDDDASDDTETADEPNERAHSE